MVTNERTNDDGLDLCISCMLHVTKLHTVNNLDNTVCQQDSQSSFNHSEFVARFANKPEDMHQRHNLCIPIKT
eukprot:3772403-Amphidinium_carterae.1